MRFARNPALRLRIIPPMNGAITRMRPCGSISILRVTRHPWPWGTTVKVVVGSSFPIRTSKTIRLGGSYSETVTVPPDTPMTGFVLISKVEPLSTVVPSINWHAGDGDGRVVPLRQFCRQRIRDRAVVLLAYGGLEEVERGREVLGVDLHVELHRCRIRMDLHDRELASFLVEEGVERDHPRLVRLDEVDYLRQILAGFLELPGFDRRRSDIDERSGHGLLPPPSTSLAVPMRGA